MCVIRSVGRRRDEVHERVLVHEVVQERAILDDVRLWDVERWIHGRGLLGPELESQRHQATSKRDQLRLSMTFLPSIR